VSVALHPSGPLEMLRLDRGPIVPTPTAKGSGHRDAADARDVSDDDLVTMAHAVEMYEALPNAELAVVPGTSHFLTQEKPRLVNQLVLDFLTNDPAQTVAPIRRAQPPA
jgi:pimeloyl-ACP methyl ester carboxylesterase